MMWRNLKILRSSRRIVHFSSSIVSIYTNIKKRNVASFSVQETYNLRGKAPVPRDNIALISINSMDYCWKLLPCCIKGSKQTCTVEPEF